MLLRPVLSVTGGGTDPGVASLEGCRIVAPRNLFFGYGLVWVGVTDRLLDAASELRALFGGDFT